MKPIMFYDGGCPLCRREVAHYRALDRGGRVDWIDIDACPQEPTRWGISKADAMAELHAIDSAGRVHRGVSAFVVIWRELPGYRHLGTLVDRLGLTPLLDRVYRRFARWRLDRRCDEGCDLRVR